VIRKTKEKETAMKNRIMILTIGLVCFYTISCQQPSFGPGVFERLTKPITISGKVTDSRTDMPISEAEVVISYFRVDLFTTENYANYTTITNQNGEYSFEEQGDYPNYKLCVSKSNYRGGCFKWPEKEFTADVSFIEYPYHIVDFKLVWLGPFECAIPKLYHPWEGAILDNGRRDGKDFLNWRFGWYAVPGATKYRLYVIGPNTNSPLINVVISSCDYVYYYRPEYIPNKDRLNWRWRVKAYVNYDTWCDWSEWRHFNVEPVNTDPPDGGC
jgi:hypothetical protein